MDRDEDWRRLKRLAKQCEDAAREAAATEPSWSALFKRVADELIEPPQPPADVARLVERLRAESERLYPKSRRDGHGYHRTAYVIDEAAAALSQSAWPPSREQIARAIAETLGWDDHPADMADALKAADAILALKPEKPNVV